MAIDIAINQQDVEVVLETIDAGLVRGFGDTTPTPGTMCIERAVSFALLLPDNEEPACVAECIRNYAIKLNDAVWSSAAARTRGLRRLGVAQLGSTHINQAAWTRDVAEHSAIANAAGAAADTDPTDAITVAGNVAATDDMLTEAAEIAVEACIRAGTEGSRFLYLATPGQGAI